MSPLFSMDMLLQPPSDNRKKNRQRSELYMAAIDADKKLDKLWSLIFLHFIREEAFNIYNTFSFAEG